MAAFYKCKNCNEEFYVYLDEDEFHFCPVCNNDKLKIIEKIDK